MTFMLKHGMDTGMTVMGVNVGGGGVLELLASRRG